MGFKERLEEWQHKRFLSSLEKAEPRLKKMEARQLELTEKLQKLQEVEIEIDPYHPMGYRAVRQVVASWEGGND